YADAVTEGWISGAEAADYVVGALDNVRSSTEDVASLNVQDGDGDDNGIAAGTDVLTALIILGDGIGLGATEPTNETVYFGGLGGDDDPDAGWASGSDAHSNFSVDFGFSPLMRVG